MKINEDIIGLGRAYLGAILITIDGYTGFRVVDLCFRGYDYVNHLGGII